MTIRISSIIIVGIIAASTLSCSEENEVKKREIVSAIAEDAQTDEEIKLEQEQIAIEEAERIAEEKRNVTSLSYDKVLHDFGTVKEESDNFTEFVVTNTGDKPLIIKNVKASCGCTMPQKPEAPIPPGETDVIKVKFHPNVGQLNEIKKTITVTANTEPVISTIDIKAFVIEK